MHGMSRWSWGLGGLPGADPAERDARIAAVVAGAEAFARRAERLLRRVTAPRLAAAWREAEAIQLPLAELETAIQVLSADGSVDAADALADAIAPAQQAVGELRARLEDRWLGLSARRQAAL